MICNGTIKGRGTSANIQNRFEQRDLVAYDDLDWDGEEEPRPRTQFLPDASKSIIAYNDSGDVGFDAGINPYRGCEHGCVYCFARPGHEYLAMSAGLDFETRIMVKHDAPRLLRQELRARKWKPQTIMMCGNTDPYQPVEKELKLTRQCLEVLNEFNNPVGMITKNKLVTRDIDILSEMAAKNCAMVYVSLTTLDLKLNRIMEPRTSSPAQRLDTIRQLADANIPVGVLTAPIIPGLTDQEIPQLLEAAADAGATQAGYIVLRLPHAVAPLFEKWLEDHFPDRKDKVLNRLRSMRDGLLYKAEIGTRMRGTGFFADRIADMFTVYARKHGFNRGSVPVSAGGFQVPVEKGDQIALF
jgi:DNA repair photolyase